MSVKFNFLNKAIRIAVVGLTPSTTRIRELCHIRPDLNIEYVGTWAPNYKDAVVVSTQIVRSNKRHLKGEGVDYPHLELGLRRDLDSAVMHADAIFVAFPYSTVEGIVQQVFNSGRPFQLEREDGSWFRLNPAQPKSLTDGTRKREERETQRPETGRASFKAPERGR